MKITTTALARACVGLLLLYPISVILVSAYLESENYGLQAALLAASAGASFLAALVFNLPEFISFTSRPLRLFIGLVAAGTGVLSALLWTADEVENIWIRPLVIAPILIALLLLMWFTDRCSKESAKHEDE